MGNKTENLSIKIYGEAILREKASELGEIKEDDLSIIEKMVDVMVANEGMGLAAPQIGIGKQIVVVRSDEDIIKLINHGLRLCKPLRKIRSHQQDRCYMKSPAFIVIIQIKLSKLVVSFRQACVTKLN